MIAWNKEDYADPKNDLCIKINGVYIDIVHSYDGTWTVFYDHCRIDEGYLTRKDAEKFASDLVRSREKPQTCRI